MSTATMFLASIIQNTKGSTKRNESESSTMCMEVSACKGCKYARLCTFSSHKAIFQDKMILNLLLLELRSSFLHIFFVF